MKKYCFIFELLLFSLFIVGCNINKESILSGEEDDKKKEKIGYSPNQYFPTVLGNSWNYFYKSIGAEAYIQIVSMDTMRHIDGTLLSIFHEGLIGFPNNEYSEKFYGNRNRDILFYSGRTDTSEDGLGNEYPTIKREILKDTIIIGQEWLTYDFPNSVPDTCRLISESDFQIDSLYYNNVILITRRTKWIIDSSYYAIDIGLIKRTNIDRYSNQINSKYTIMDYQLN